MRFFVLLFAVTTLSQTSSAQKRGTAIIEPDSEKDPFVHDAAARAKKKDPYGYGHEQMAKNRMQNRNPQNAYMVRRL